MNNSIIKRLRKTKGLTQYELAERSGLSFAHIKIVEHDDYDISTMSLKNLKMLAKGLGVSVLYILDRYRYWNGESTVKVSTKTLKSIIDQYEILTKSVNDLKKHINVLKKLVEYNK